MSIRPIGPSSSIPPASSSGSPGSSTDQPHPAPTSGGSDSVHLDGSQALQRALQDPSQDVNVAQVDAVRLAVANGTYQPNARGIADGLLASVRDMLRARPRRARRDA